MPTLAIAKGQSGRLCDRLNRKEIVNANAIEIES
jgi:hypothetical protein